MKPSIIISSLDAERLEALLDTAKPDTASTLLEEIGRAKVVDPQDMPPAVVTMNSKVRFEVAPPREEFCMTLAYPKDMASLIDGLSILTPIGAALLGLSVGDVIDWPRRDGAMQSVRVLEVVYQPEESGHFFR